MTMEKIITNWLGIRVRIIKAAYSGTQYEITFAGWATAYKLTIGYAETGWCGSLSTTSGIPLHSLKAAAARELYYKLADVTYAQAA